MKIKAIIIDDEYLNRDLIRTYITRLNLKFEILADVDNINDAYDLIDKYKPDVIFLDIKMPDGNGFDLLKRYDKLPFEVVFITGFDEFAIQAFEFNALDYVLKPIDLDKLKVALQRVSEKVSLKLPLSNYFKDIIDSFNIDYSKIIKIPIHFNNKVVLIDINKIVSITNDNGCSVFKTNEYETFLSSRQVSSFEFVLSNYQNFRRLNKSVYVNLNFVKSYTKGNDCFVTLIDDTSFEISRRKKAEILAILDLKN
jgi:two-component system, LytTR family, response regulator